MKRSEEIDKLIAEKSNQRKNGFLVNEEELLDLSWEAWDIKMDLKPDYEIRVKVATVEIP